ncbi:MAG: proteasome accessory factor PafA2 family protein [Verrucomicrobiales bacterium]
MGGQSDKEPILARIVGIETEYGCLVTSNEAAPQHGSWPGRVRDYAFKQAKLGALDQHYRGHEEPPGNGGFLINGGRLYLDMGHLEYSTPECLGPRDLAAWEMAGELLVQETVRNMGAVDEVSFIKNNIDHHTNATFGCHENYLIRRYSAFRPGSTEALLSFLATRSIFSGSGRVGVVTDYPTLFEMDGGSEPRFQITQRADFIVNDIYQWVQFNRAIINARDEPLSDFQRFQRLHLLMGDANMSPFASALKVGSTCLVLSCLEMGLLPANVALLDPVQSIRHVSRDASRKWEVDVVGDRKTTAMEVQFAFLELAESELRGADADLDWALVAWRQVLEMLPEPPEHGLGLIDWATKEWLLKQFLQAEGTDWNDPRLASLDLEYHHICPSRSLHWMVPVSEDLEKFRDDTLAQAEKAVRLPPSNTRAKGRALAVETARDSQNSGYVINWDGFSIEGNSYLPMGDPFLTYVKELRQLLAETHSA